MKAWVLHGISDLRCDEVSQPNLGVGDVLVKVEACGICSSDIPRIFVNGTYHFPTIPGHEFSGLVVKAGDDSVERWVGKRVGIFPLIPCMQCAQCVNGKYEMCENYNYLGSRCDGGFAEYVKVPAWNLIEIPDGISWEEAALLEPAAVALHAVHAALEGVEAFAGVNALVSGSGAIGILVGSWLQSFGCKDVVVLGRNEAKRSLVENARLCYKSKLDGMENHFQVAIDAVGSPQSIESCLKALKPGGTLVALGNPTGDMSFPRNVYWKLLRKQLTVRGVWNSSYESEAQSEWTDVITAIEQGDIDLSAVITHRFSLGALGEALNVMRSDSESYGRVVVSGW